VQLYLRRTETLPRKPGEQEAIDRAQGPAATILVVDDDPDVRAFLTESLDSLGYAAVAVEGGSAALKGLERISPDAMILDFAMPGMNGAEVAKRIRQRRPDLPIIFASGYSETAAIRSATGDRSRVLHKPFKVHELQAALAELLTDQKQ
jgi:CheY-like chemotaxis protein